MAKKTDKLYVIDCYCDECYYHHNDEVYDTEEEAKEVLKTIDVKDHQDVKVKTLEDQLQEIQYWYY